MVGARSRNQDWRNRLLTLHFNARFDRQEDVRIGWSIVKWRASSKRAGNLGHDTRMLRRIRREVCAKPCQERASEIISLPVIRERFIEAVRRRWSRGFPHFVFVFDLMRYGLRDEENLSDRRPDRFAVSTRSYLANHPVALSWIDQLSEIYFSVLSPLFLYLSL